MGNRGKLTVVKIGGNVIDKPQELERFLEDFARIEGAKLLVHGGGALASAMLRDMGVEPQMVGGRRITDADTLKVVTMVYAGWINKDIVARLQSLGCNAAGFSGADGNIVPAVKRPSVPVDFGYVGDIEPEKIDSALIEKILEEGITPVFCPITHDGQGSLLNTNADTIASGLASALSVKYDVSLIYCFEKKGVLSDPDNDDSVIPTMCRKDYEKLKKSGSIKDGMIAKLENVFFALEHGVMEVSIKLADELLRDGGTILKL